MNARQFLESQLKERGIDEEPTLNQISEIMDSYMLEKAGKILRGYESWEAELIADNRCWAPNGMASNPRLTNELYDKMMTLQAFRNSVLHPGKYSSPDDDSELDKIVSYKP